MIPIVQIAGYRELRNTRFIRLTLVLFPSRTHHRTAHCYDDLQNFTKSQNENCWSM